MKTQNELSENLTTEQKKACALRQFHSEDFFLSDDDGNVIIYEGTQEEAEEKYQEYLQSYEDENGDRENADTFELWCNNELTQVEEYDNDDYNQDYICLTDDEADEKAAEYIKDSLWAFNASFIIEHSKLSSDAEEMIKSYQEDKCEGANDTIEALIEDMDEFISDAISADGRGHFMSSYDGNENEETFAGETFYIYRIN